MVLMIKHIHFHKKMVDGSRWCFLLMMWMMHFQRTVLGFLVIPGRSLSEVSAMVVDSFDYSLLQVSLWSYLDAGCGVCCVVGVGMG